MCYVLAPKVVGDANSNPPSFTYTVGQEVLTVVRIDSKIEGKHIEAECQAVDPNYFELHMDNNLEYEVNIGSDVTLE